MQSPTRFGARSIAAEGLPAAVLQCGWHQRAGELKRESLSPRLRSAGGVSGPRGAREPRRRQGEGPAWSGTRPPAASPRVLAPPAAVAVDGDGSPLDQAARRGLLGKTLPRGGGLGSGGATSMLTALLGPGGTWLPGWRSRALQEDRGGMCPALAARCAGSLGLSCCHPYATASSAVPRSHQTLLPSGEAVAAITSWTPGLSVPKPFPSCCPQTRPPPLAVRTAQLCSQLALGLGPGAAGWRVLAVGCCPGFPGPSIGMQAAAVGETEAREVRAATPRPTEGGKGASFGRGLARGVGWGQQQPGIAAPLPWALPVPAARQPLCHTMVLSSTQPHRQPSVLALCIPPPQLPSLHPSSPPSLPPSLLPCQPPPAAGGGGCPLLLPTVTDGRVCPAPLEGPFTALGLLPPGGAGGLLHLALVFSASPFIPPQHHHLLWQH